MQKSIVHSFLTLYIKNEYHRTKNMIAIHDVLINYV